MSAETVEFLKKVIYLIKPKAYNRITIIGVTGGLALIGSPYWVPILEAILKTEFNLPIPEFDEKVIGGIIVLASLIYNVVYRWNELRTSSNEKTTKYLFRKKARRAVKVYLDENKKIFDKYGPNSNFAKSNPYEAQKQWTRLSKEKIIPNNQKIIQIVEKNRHLFKGNESEIFDDFKIHANDFSFNKSGKGLSSSVTFFPKDFSKIFK